MKLAKYRLENAVFLWNITDLQPKLDKDTTWSGKNEQSRRFERIRKNLITAADDPNRDIIVNGTHSFAAKNLNLCEYRKQLVT